MNKMIKSTLIINNISYKIIGDYKNKYEKVIIEDDDGYKYYISTYSIIHNPNKPRIFTKSNPFTIYNINRWLNINNKQIELISDKYINTHDMLTFKCLSPNCLSIFNNSWSNVYRGVGCPYCNGKKVNVTNCLATINPELALEWHPVKNGDLTPYNVTARNTRNVWWVCKNGHEWVSSIYNRDNGSGCPCCFGVKATTENNLFVNNFKLCEEWDYNKNAKSPEDYTPNSGHKVWWKCSICNRSWQAVIRDRNSSHYGCPYCSGKLPTEEYNLLVLYPDICAEWDYLKNLKSPETYLPHSKEHVWWTCKNNHHYKAQISNRVYGTGCPICKQSKGELTIQNWLLNNKFYFEPEFSFDGLIGDARYPLRFDFAIFNDEEKTSLNCLIEYDGEFHFKQYFKEQNYRKMQRYDKKKNEYCVKHHIQLLRIPYWDFNNIEEILSRELMFKK